MSKVLIVLCHPNPKSFTANWAEASARACLEQGYEVVRSDLYTMGFDPAERESLYHTGGARDEFDPLKAQEAASKKDNLPEDVANEIDKIKQADLIIFHFPVWWFAAPAMLKGWCDRVLAHGEMHDVDNRFDTGLFKGKRALFCVTTGSRASESLYNGKEGDINMLLWPLAYTLRYLGFTVLQPSIIHGVHGYHEGIKEQKLEARLKDALDQHKTTVANLNDRAEIQFNMDREFDEDGRLRADAQSHSQFIRHQE